MLIIKKEEKNKQFQYQKSPILPILPTDKIEEKVLLEENKAITETEGSKDIKDIPVISHADLAPNPLLVTLKNYEHIARQNLARRKTYFQIRLQNKLFGDELLKSTSSTTLNSPNTTNTTNTPLKNEDDSLESLTGLPQSVLEAKETAFSERKIILGLCAFVAVKYIVMASMVAMFAS